VNPFVDLSQKGLVLGEPRVPSFHGTIVEQVTRMFCPRGLLYESAYSD
jgi:hypothetical protein